MPMYIKVRDQLFKLTSAIFEYDNHTRTYKVIIKTRGNQLLRISATEKEPMKLAIAHALKSILTTGLHQATYPIDLTNQVLQAEVLYHPKDIQGYTSNFSQNAESNSVEPKESPSLSLPTSLILVSESYSSLKSQMFMHVLEGKTAVKVTQYNLSKGGNLFNIVFSNNNLTLSENNSLPILKLEIDPQEIDNLAYQYKSLDGVRRAFDKQVKQATQAIFSNPPSNGVIAPQFLLNHYQHILPRFTKQSVVHLKQA